MVKFSIVIPVYNEAKNLSKLLIRLYKVLKRQKFELIIVDDNSNDGTQKIFKNFRKKNLKYIVRKGKRDLSKSCILGFNKTKYKKILVMDGDLQHKPSDIKKFLTISKKENPDIIVGSRNLFKQKKHNLGSLRLFASRLLIIIVNILLGKKTSDPMSGFFMFKKSIYKKYESKLLKKGYKILLDLIYVVKEDLILKDVNINFGSRKDGSSKMSFKILYYLIIMIFNKFIIRVSNK